MYSSHQSRILKKISAAANTDVATASPSFASTNFYLLKISWPLGMAIRIRPNFYPISWTQNQNLQFKLQDRTTGLPLPNCFQR